MVQVETLPNNALDPTAVSVSDFMRFDFTESISYPGRAVPAVGQLGRSVNMQTLYAILVFCFFAIVTGCGPRAKATFQSGRRVVGSHYQTPSLEVVNYFPSTNEVRIFDGTMGGFSGTVTGAVISSNATSWHLQFISHGRIGSGGSVRETQHVDVPFPKKAKIQIRGVGEVKVWFLSDQEISQNQDMFAK